jgi:hypothetical protein
VPAGTCEDDRVVEHAAVDRAWERYRAAIEQMAQLDNGRGEVQVPAKHNRLVDQMRAQRSVLGTSEAGRKAISSLLSDPRAVVRLWAAGDALAWDEESARQVLEDLRDSPSAVGLHAVSAKYTLREFDAGRLA